MFTMGKCYVYFTIRSGEVNVQKQNYDKPRSVRNMGLWDNFEDIVD